MEYDTIIRNGTIIDGTRLPRYRADVGIRNGRVARIGRIPASVAAGRELDASGLIVAPGFVDLHCHYDAQIHWDPWCTISGWHGVTSLVMGNCGFTIAPCRPADRDLVMRNLTHVEGMSIEALRAGIDWGFESFPQYLDMLGKNGVGPNVACFVGHSGVRTFVMRGDAPKRAASA